MSSGNIIDITKETFTQQVLNSDIPVLVDFWADWCGPCKMIAPVIQKLADEYTSKLKVCKVNVDEEGILSAEHMVMSIPTLIIFKDGQVVNKIVGVKTYPELSSTVDKFI